MITVQKNVAEVPRTIPTLHSKNENSWLWIRKKGGKNREYNGQHSAVTSREATAVVSPRTASLSQETEEWSARTSKGSPWNCRVMTWIEHVEKGCIYFATVIITMAGEAMSRHTECGWRECKILIAVYISCRWESKKKPDLISASLQAGNTALVDITTKMTLHN